jgi:hypothetical protein
MLFIGMKSNAIISMYVYMYWPLETTEESVCNKITQLQVIHTRIYTHAFYWYEIQRHHQCLCMYVCMYVCIVHWKPQRSLCVTR